MSEDSVELRLRAAEERADIVFRYDRGRDEGAEIPDWEDPDMEIYHVMDRYGFIHDERQDHVKKRTDHESKNIEKELTRREKWLNMVEKNDQKNNQTIYFPLGAKYRGKMIDRVWKGVPLAIRPTFWAILLDIDTLKEQHKNTYHQMKDLARKYSPDIRQIDLDVNRTYRNTTFFRERYNSRQQDLFHVLAAYSMYNTEVGYCQGMSQIAALLLIFLNTDEDAFWGLHMLMVGDKYKMHGLFIPQFPKLVRFQEHFDKILRKKLYRLYKHLVKNEVSSNIYTIKWFFLCFLDRIPFSLSLRVWDLYLLEGEQIMLAMGYTILKMHQRDLLKKGMDDLLEFIQVNLGRDFGFDDDKVMESLRTNLDELKRSGLHLPSSPPSQAELPEKPFGTPNIPTAEEEAGYRQPFSEKERHVSLQAIQREQENVHRLSRLASQTSLEEEPNDHSLNETVSGGDVDYDRHSESLEPDISIEGHPLDRSQTNTSSDVSLHIQTPAPPEQFRNSSDYSAHSPRPSSQATFREPVISPPPSHQTEVYPPPSPLPPSHQQDELDRTVISMLEECGSLDRHSSNSHRSMDRHSSSRQSIDRHSSNSRRSIERVASSSSSSNKPQPRGASVSLHRLTTDNSTSGNGAHIDADMYAQVRPASADPRTAMYHHMAAQDTNNTESYHQRSNDVESSNSILRVESSSTRQLRDTSCVDSVRKRYSAHIPLSTSHDVHPELESCLNTPAFSRENMSVPKPQVTSNNASASTPLGQPKPSRIPLSAPPGGSISRRGGDYPREESSSPFSSQVLSPVSPVSSGVMYRSASPVTSAAIYRSPHSPPTNHIRSPHSPPTNHARSPHSPPPNHSRSHQSPPPNISPVRSAHTNHSPVKSNHPNQSSRMSESPVPPVKLSANAANPSQVQKNYSASKQTLQAQDYPSARKSSIGSSSAAGGSRIPISSDPTTRRPSVTSPTLGATGLAQGPRGLAQGPGGLAQGSVASNGNADQRQTSPPFSPPGPGSRIPKLNSAVTSPTGSFSGSGGRTPSKTYYYGENPNAASNYLANGVVDEIMNARVAGARGETTLGATPHKGEVLRIRVGSERGDRGPSIHREDKEISPRFQDHKVTIQVNQSNPDLGPSSINQSNSLKHSNTKQVTSTTKKFVSSSSKKVGVDGHVHQTSRSQMYQHHTDSAKGKNEVSSMYEESRLLDGTVVSQAHEYNHNSALPQVQTSPDIIKSSENKISRSGRRSGDLAYNTETLF